MSAREAFMAGCAICSNPVVRKIDRLVRLGYLTNFAELIGPPLVKDEKGTHGDHYSIRVCSQCRYDLAGMIRRWLDGEWIKGRRRRLRRLVDQCPVCGHDPTQDARTLRVAGIPGL